MNDALVPGTHREVVIQLLQGGLSETEIYARNGTPYRALNSTYIAAVHSIGVALELRGVASHNVSEVAR